MTEPVPPSRSRRGKNGSAARRGQFQCVALLLQGGGALGAYQGGVFQALAEADLQPDWVAGISIGAINAAIIAGNPPEKRVAQLRAFWERITGRPLSDWAVTWAGDGKAATGVGAMTMGLLDQLSAFHTMVAGAPGFFEPRLQPPWLSPAGSAEATSLYDTSALKTTLEALVDFDRINSKAMRFSVGAVNVRTGNFVYFDTQTDKIRPEHILASGALPPGFPAIEIEGERYWDGGLVSNTPLHWVVDDEPRQDMLAFQVDLWSARGAFPCNLTDVAVRLKEIQYSSRTRAATDRLKRLQRTRSALTTLLRDLPEGLRDSAAAKLLGEFADLKAYNIVQLIYRTRQYEGNSKDYEFSRSSMIDHWRAGFDDAVRALRHPEIFERPCDEDGFRSFDFQDETSAGHHPIHPQEESRS